MGAVEGGVGSWAPKTVSEGELGAMSALTGVPSWSANGTPLPCLLKGDRKVVPDVTIVVVVATLPLLPFR